VPSPSPRLHGARVALWSALRFAVGSLCFVVLGAAIPGRAILAGVGTGLAGLASRGAAPVASMVGLAALEGRAPLSPRARDPPA